MANNRFSKELEDLLKEERKAISLDGLLQNDVISEQQDNVTYEDVLKDLDESIAEEQEKPIIEQPEETFSIEDTLPFADQPQDALPEDTTPPADQPEDALPEDTTPPADQTKDEFTTDPLAYVRKKYNISSETPDTSYQDLKDLQRRASIQRSVSNLDKALGKLGSWYDVEAKRRGYDVPGYTGGAFERSAEESEKQFKERQAFQEKQRQKEEQEFTKTKSAFDFERTLREFDQSVKSQQEMNDPNSLASKSMREVIAGLYGENAVPQNISGNQMLRLFPDLKELTKTKLQSDLRRQEEREKFGFEKELKGMELAKEGGLKLSKGEEKADVEFAKKYADWISEKGSIGADKGIANLETAISEMENNPELTGGTRGLIYAVAPESIKSALNEKIGMIETRLRSAVVDTLRPLLGAQFAAVEGERIFKQTFDSNQPMSENISRAELVLKDLKNQVESRKKAIDYWENFGTLKGYKAFEPQQPAQKVQTDRVNVRDKNGKRFSIPKRQLERALSEGYEVIE